MMSATPLELDYIGLSKTSASQSYSCLKTELSLSLPGSQSPGSSNPVLGLSLFSKETPANGYAFNSGVRGKDFPGCGGKRGFADSSGNWGLAVNGGSEVEVGKGAALFSQGAGKGVNVLEIGKKPGQPKDMDIDVGIASHKSLMEKKHVNGPGSAPATKAQVVGWPPIRSFRKNSMASASIKNINEADENSGSICLYVKVSMDGAPYLRKLDLKLYKNYRELSLALKTMFSCFPVGNGKDGLSDSHQNDLSQGSECVLTYEDKDGDWMLVGDVPWDMFTGSCKRLRIMKGSEAIGMAPMGEEN